MLIEAAICVQLCIRRPTPLPTLPYEVEVAIVDLGIWRGELRHIRKQIEIAPGLEIWDTRARFDHAMRMCLLIATALGDSDGQSCLSQ